MLRLGCCCLHMQEMVFVDSQEGLLSSRGGGGGRHTGTRLTKLINVWQSEALPLHMLQALPDLTSQCYVFTSDEEQ